MGDEQKKLTESGEWSEWSVGGFGFSLGGDDRLGFEAERSHSERASKQKNNRIRRMERMKRMGIRIFAGRRICRASVS
jgi:hypothetical protein